MSAPSDCRHGRLAIGGDPLNLPEDVQRHIAGCPSCAKFRDETLAMEGRLKAALDLPLHKFRAPAAPSRTRRYALAASVLLAVFIGAGAWVLLPRPALAEQLVEHLRHEPGSWTLQRRLSPEEVAGVLQQAGVSYDSRLPIVYASPCEFRGHVVPHLVVQTERGPVTVILLAHEKVEHASEFQEGEYRGSLVPAGEGSVALVTRDGQDAGTYLDLVLAGFR
jgi:Protein of unknown function (DUF3379)